MNAAMVWILAGVPALVLGLGLFAARSPLRAVLGYLVLGAGFAAVATVDRGSAGLFAGILALLYAAGRGTRRERSDLGRHADEHDAASAGRSQLRAG